MLGDKIGLNICYGEKNVELLLNMQSIKNLYTLTNTHPFKVLQNLIYGGKEGEERDTLLGQVVYSLSNGEITIEDIYNYVVNIDKEEKEELIKGISTLICAELFMEIEDEDSIEDKKNTNAKEQNSSKDKEDDTIKEIQKFIELWDYYYYIATVVLKKTEEDFYKLTPRELKTLEALDSRYKREILIKTYIDINTPRENNESDITTDKNEVDSFLDLF